MRQMPISSLDEFRAAIERIKAPKFTHIRLYRGQSEPRELLPSLFRDLRLRPELIAQTEAKRLCELKARIPAGIPLRPNNDWDWLSFGQHFGMHTRLLDWSKDPLIALYFAVQKIAFEPTVFIYHAQKGQFVDEETKRTSVAMITKTKIMDPSVHSVRVALQKGLHTVHRLHPRKAGGKIVLDLASMEWHKGRLATVQIDPGSRPSLLVELNKQGIRYETVYGDFEKVCKNIP